MTRNMPPKKLISPLPPFASPYRYTMYSYHIYKWISDCVVERYKALDKEEAKEYKERIRTLAGLKEEGKRFLAEVITSNELLDVIMDTIIWDDFIHDVFEMGINQWFYEDDSEEVRDAVATVRPYISRLEAHKALGDACDGFKSYERVRPMRSKAESDAITLLINKQLLQFAME